MSATLSCPNCGTTLTVDRREIDREARCDRCGTVIHPLSTAWNPYAPPSSTLGDPVEGTAGVTDVPPSVLGKFGLASRLLAGNLALFSLVILTVWLPINLVIESIESNAPPGQEGFASLRLNYMAQGFFGPISIGALIFALSGRMRGERVTYPQALVAGLSNWGRLFIANFVAGLLILAGYVCLIIPGIILQIRFSLLDAVVVLEPDSPPRPRSTELTRGKAWQILSAGLLFMTLYLPLAFAAGFALESLELPDAFWLNVVADCILDVVGSIFTIVMFLFYWESRQQLGTIKAKAPDPDGDFGGWEMSPVGS
jgi:hypothetical protein